MSDNLPQYRAIRAALTQGYPGEPTGRVARHIATLAALISGIVAVELDASANAITPPPRTTRSRKLPTVPARWSARRPRRARFHFRLATRDCCS